MLVGGAPATKASRQVAAAEPIVVLGPPPPFVSRGGQKLDGALERFPVRVEGRSALDAGASTGGFTDCLLQRGAASVTSVDVGHGQLHEKLRRDPRVSVFERVHIRDFEGGPYELIVADLSFISLRTVAEALFGRLAQPGADVVALVKPQFEAPRAEASKGRGVIRDPQVWRRALEGVRTAIVDQGATMMDIMVSPLTGAEGNVEFLAHAVAHRDGPSLDDAALDAVVAEAAPAADGG
ncbi:MAG: RNA binding methyltransferase FtsJ like [uncultured Acidimicrobiales bacterium]|uniref:RNA binding methyltransferase FtsJ like n=1 Tax=uncultured Acidimicrobiales bacterium TaxID=310071 RepID=A0A6J4HF39_9ACTN|nr:MAG: RNA binding methyltransferase FtsJ like [uncultured Acidimicrobiales bacterium]